MKRTTLAVSSLAWGLLAAVALAALAPAAARTDPEPEAAVHSDAVPPAPSVAERLAEIRRRLQQALSYPPAARERGLSGVTRIRFEIAGDRRAVRIETARSSGYRILDRAAEQAARDAGELPMVYGRLEVPVRFSLAP